MTTEVRVFPVGHAVQVHVLDMVYPPSDPPEWEVAHTYIFQPGRKDNMPLLYATTTRKIVVMDLEPDSQ